MRIELTIDADSIDTGNRKRDEHLRSDRLLPRRRAPAGAVHFDPRPAAGDGVLHIEGRLEAAGKFVPLEFDAAVQQVDHGLEIEATTTVDPRELGMSSGLLGMIRPPATVHVETRLNDTKGKD